MIIETINSLLFIVTGILPFVLFYAAKARNIPFSLEIAGLMMFWGSLSYFFGSEYAELSGIALKISLIVFVIHIAVRKHSIVVKEREREKRSINQIIHH